MWEPVAVLAHGRGGGNNDVRFRDPAAIASGLILSMHSVFDCPHLFYFGYKRKVT